VQFSLRYAPATYHPVSTRRKSPSRIIAFMVLPKSLATPSSWRVCTGLRPSGCSWSSATIRRHLAALRSWRYGKVAVAACKRCDAGLQTVALVGPRSLRTRRPPGSHSLHMSQQSLRTACKQHPGPRYIANIVLQHCRSKKKVISYLVGGIHSDLNEDLRKETTGKNARLSWRHPSSDGQAVHGIDFLDSALLAIAVSQTCCLQALRNTLWARSQSMLACHPVYSQ
jgi:hypothetical protein